LFKSVVINYPIYFIINNEIFFEKLDLSIGNVNQHNRFSSDIHKQEG